MNLRKSTIDFMIFMYENKGKITKAENPFFGYYLQLWYLRDKGLAKECGLSDKGQKIWTLTPLGVEVAKRFKEIEELIENAK